MTVKWTDNRIDILQNLEFSIVVIWRAHKDMSDYSALRAYEAAFQWYRAELRGHTPKAPSLSGLDASTFDALKAMCEFRIRNRFDSLSGSSSLRKNTLTYETRH